MFSFCSTKGEITFISLTSGSFLECKYLVYSLSPSLSYTHICTRWTPSAMRWLHETLGESA